MGQPSVPALHAECNRSIDMSKTTVKELKANTFEFIDHSCKDIAQARRMSEIEGIDVEEFDKHLNECCTKWAKHYEDMDPIRLMFEGLNDIFAAGQGQDFMEDLMKKLGE